MKGTPERINRGEDKTKLTNFKRGFRFLGYDFKGGYKGISMKSLDKLKDTIRDIARRTQGVNLIAVIKKLNPVIRGHVNYFRLGDVKKTLSQIRLLGTDEASMSPNTSIGDGKPTTNVSQYTDSQKWDYSHLNNNFVKGTSLCVRATLWGR